MKWLYLAVLAVLAGCNESASSFAQPGGNLDLGAHLPADALAAALDAAVPADASVVSTAVDGAIARDLATASSGAAACSVPAMDQIYTGFLPTNPYGAATPSNSCIASAHDAIVVLGCPNNDDGTPATCQTERADIAVALEAAGWGNRYIPTGAAVKNSYVEADTLSMLLKARGVAASAIVPERQAKHTDENIYYSTKIMEANGWVSAWIVSEDPGHLIMTAVCDSNCCVDLGRLTIYDLSVGGKTRKVGHYVRYPWATPVSSTECQTIESPIKLMCTNQSSRLACADNFKL